MSTIECQTELRMDTISKYEQQIGSGRDGSSKRENISTVGHHTTEGVTERREKSNFGQIFHASKEFPNHYFVDQSITFTEIKPSDLKNTENRTIT